MAERAPVPAEAHRLIPHRPSRARRGSASAVPGFLPSSCVLLQSSAETNSIGTPKGRGKRSTGRSGAVSAVTALGPVLLVARALRSCHRPDLARTQCAATSTARGLGRGSGGGSVEGGTAQLGLRLEGVRAEWCGRQSWGPVSPPLPNATSFRVVSRLGPSGGQVRKAAELHESRVGDRLLVNAGFESARPDSSPR